MKHEDESSLELLLDTMCNTFGGVMFIAITVAVVLFSKQAVEVVRTPEERSEVRREELMAQIDTLRQKIAEEITRQNQLNQEVQILETDPRLKSLKQIAALEELIKAETAKMTLLAKEVNFLESEVIKKNAELQKMTLDQKQLENQLLAMTAEIERKKQVIAAMMNQLNEQKSLSMTFTILESHDDKTPFYILLKNNRLYRIGPENNVDNQGIMLPCSEMDYTISGTSVICTPKANMGVDALSGDSLSSGCLAMLRGIPQNRGVTFCFGKEDAATFYTMRELLKKQNVFHGFSIQKNTDTFTYVITNKAHYEY